MVRWDVEVTLEVVGEVEVVEVAEDALKALW